MGRIFVWLLAFVSISWILRKLRGAATPPPSGSSSQPEQVAMVRDPVCGTFLPERKAHHMETPEGVLSFCSSNCRDRYLAQK